MLASSGRPRLGVLKNLLLQIPPDQFQHLPIRDFALHFFQEQAVVNRVEVALDVRVHHVRVARFQERVHPPEGVLASAPRPESVAVFHEPILEDRLHRVSEGRLHNPVFHRGYPKWS
jgi:hypothetical protein